MEGIIVWNEGAHGADYTTQRAMWLELSPFTQTQHRPAPFYSNAERARDWTQDVLCACEWLIMLSIQEYTHWHKLSNIHQLNVLFYHKLISYQRTGKVWIANFRCNSDAKSAAEWVFIRIRFLISSCQYHRNQLYFSCI